MAEVEVEWLSTASSRLTRAVVKLCSGPLHASSDLSESGDAGVFKASLSCSRELRAASYLSADAMVDRGVCQLGRGRERLKWV